MTRRVLCVLAVAGVLTVARPTLDAAGAVEVLPGVDVAPEEEPAVRSYLLAVRDWRDSQPALDWWLWERLAECESAGRWDIETGNGFSGGLQHAPGTWLAYGGGRFAPRASGATQGQQIAVARRVLAAQGWNAWPGCARKLRLAG